MRRGISPGLAARRTATPGLWKLGGSEPMLLPGAELRSTVVLSGSRDLGFGENIAHYSPYLKRQTADYVVRSPHDYNYDHFFTDRNPGAHDLGGYSRCWNDHACMDHRAWRKTQRGRCDPVPVLDRRFGGYLGQLLVSRTSGGPCIADIFLADVGLGSRTSDSEAAAGRSARRRSLFHDPATRASQLALFK